MRKTAEGLRKLFQRTTVKPPSELPTVKIIEPDQHFEVDTEGTKQQPTIQKEIEAMIQRGYLKSNPDRPEVVDFFSDYQESPKGQIHRFITYHLNLSTGKIWLSAWQYGSENEAVDYDQGHLVIIREMFGHTSLDHIDQQANLPVRKKEPHPYAPKPKRNTQ